MLLHGVHAGEAIAKKRRMPSAKGFDFFVESSFVELYNESCHDLYAKGADVGSNLQVCCPCRSQTNVPVSTSFSQLKL